MSPLLGKEIKAVFGPILINKSLNNIAYNLLNNETEKLIIEY